MTALLIFRLPETMNTQLNRWLTTLVTPYKRYQYQRVMHALRLALAATCASVIGYVFQLRHGEWIGITVFVVLGTVPYQGSITNKAYERILGTVLGMMVGLGLLWLNQNWLYYSAWFFVLIGVISALCGWKSLGKHGYAAMLAGLTMCMLLGSTDENWVLEGVMRSVNVVIGALIALTASLLIPIKSTFMWRFTLADNLSACARQLSAITEHKKIRSERYQQLLDEQRVMNQRLVKTRSLLTATACESKISTDMLESMQQSQRSIVSSIDLMLSGVPKLPKPRLSAEEEQLLSRHFFRLQYDLRLASLLLKGEWRQHIVVAFDEEEDVRILAHKLPFETQGFVWTSLNIRAELYILLTLLQYHRKQWLSRNEVHRLGETL